MKGFSLNKMDGFEYNRSYLPSFGVEPVSAKHAREPLIAQLYEAFLENGNTVAFVDCLSRHYNSGTLQRLAGHDQREVRRAAVFALGQVAEYDANHTLGRAMLDEDRTVRTLAEAAIRKVWLRIGSPRQRRHLVLISRLNAARQYREAVRHAQTLLDEAPHLAEAWNLRATALFHQEHYPEAIRDCHEALEINPYHFLAATTMGHAYLELDSYVSALECFRRALRLNPDLEGVRMQVVRLARLVEE